MAMSRSLKEIQTPMLIEALVAAKSVGEESFNQSLLVEQFTKMGFDYTIENIEKELLSQGITLVFKDQDNWKVVKTAGINDVSEVVAMRGVPADEVEPSDTVSLVASMLQIGVTPKEELLRIFGESLVTKAEKMVENLVIVN